MTEHDPMDSRLRAYADHWREAAPPAPAVDLDRLRARPRAAGTWWLAAASAAAVAVAILGGAHLVGERSDRTPPDPAATVKPTSVVPWAPLPATHPQIPSETAPPSPDSAEAAGKPACRASDLRATTDGVGGAMGTNYLTAQLELVGREPCRLEGYPHLQLMDRGRPVVIPLEHRRDDGVYRSPVLVAPGQPASLQLAWGSLWCTTPVHNDTIRLRLDGGNVEYPGFGRSPYCDGTPGSGPTPILVDTYRPLKTRDAEPQTAYAGVEVAGDLDLTATTGAPVDFTVTLTSPEDLVLDPCPDFRIVQTDVTPHENAYALNCAAVPYRDGHGRPYLPAGKPVTFAMRTTAGPPAPYKLSWVLDTVDVKGVSGTLTVTDEPSGTSSPTTDPADAADPKTVQAGVAAIQAFLDTWRQDGLFVASHQYIDASSRPPSAVGLPRLSYGKVLSAHVSSWESSDRFTLEVSLDLHFKGDPMAWDDGENDRFVAVTRDSGRFLLSFATSP